MTQEKFNLPGYEIAETGTVTSWVVWRGQSARFMDTTKNKNGYHYVRLTIDNKRIKVYIHQWVCNKYHGQKPSNKHMVRHLDGDVNNNNASNLAWGTMAENCEDRTKHGRLSKIQKQIWQQKRDSKTFKYQQNGK